MRGGASIINNSTIQSLSFMLGGRNCLSAGGGGVGSVSQQVAPLFTWISSVLFKMPAVHV